MIVGIVSFILGVLISAIIFTCIYYKKIFSYKDEIANYKAKLNITADLQNLVKNDFTQIAVQTIKQEQEDLRKQNREVLEEKLSPLSKELNEFKEKVDKFNLSGIENTVKIIEQITNLEKNNKIIETETRNLVEALTKNQNVKGAYGENLLELVLTSCGMQEGIHYSKQVISNSENLKDNNFHTIRPDVVVNLPDNRYLIIDSKVTLTSYLAYVEDNSKIKEFKQEVKKRIVDLANKNYQNAENLFQPDFVLMYMPIENSLNLIYEDFEIINLAYKSNIIIVGTSSLLATIRLVNQLFETKKQSENINKIVKAGCNLYETFVIFCNELINLQTSFQNINKDFTTLINRFKRGNKHNPSLFSQVEELRNLGISSNNSIPKDLLENSEEVFVND